MLVLDPNLRKVESSIRTSESGSLKSVHESIYKFDYDKRRSILMKSTMVYLRNLLKTNGLNHKSKSKQILVDRVLDSVVQSSLESSGAVPEVKKIGEPENPMKKRKIHEALLLYLLLIISADLSFLRGVRKYDLLRKQ